MEEFKHGLKERMNGILFYMVFLTLPILVLINIDSTTLLRTFLNDIVLSIIECLVPINVDLTRFSNILDYIVLIIIELIIILSLDGLFSIIGKRYINKITMCKNGVNHSVDGDEYSAVLIGNNLSWIQNIYTNEGAGGLCLLKKYFKNTNKNYIICQKVGKSQFDRFVLDDKCQELYILGHGSKRSFSVNNENDGKIYYSEYKDAPKKESLPNYIVHIV